MSIESGLIALAIIIWIAAQYGLAAALHDLRRDPPAREANPVGWALVILCLPVAGPLLDFRQAAAHGRPAGRPARRSLAPPARRARTVPGRAADWPWDDDPPAPGRAGDRPLRARDRVSRPLNVYSGHDDDARP
ncbi:MAG: hypothetical protein ACKOWF_15700 [Chloroflexota bacterium]